VLIVRVSDTGNLPDSGKAIISALGAAKVPYRVAGVPSGLATQFSKRTQIEIMPK
jgi:hypothetical protein